MSPSGWAGMEKRPSEDGLDWESKQITFSWMFVNHADGRQTHTRSVSSHERCSCSCLRASGFLMLLSSLRLTFVQCTVNFNLYIQPIPEEQWEETPDPDLDWKLANMFLMVGGPGNPEENMSKKKTNLVQ